MLFLPRVVVKGPFGKATGEPITNANLFHLAPHECLKFPGRRSTGREAKHVIETGLAKEIVNPNPDGIDHGLEQM